MNQVKELADFLNCSEATVIYHAQSVASSIIADGVKLEQINDDVITAYIHHSIRKERILRDRALTRREKFADLIFNAIKAEM